MRHKKFRVLNSATNVIDITIVLLARLMAGLIIQSLGSTFWVRHLLPCIITNDLSYKSDAESKGQIWGKGLIGAQLFIGYTQILKIFGLMLRPFLPPSFEEILKALR